MYDSEKNPTHLNFYRIQTHLLLICRSLQCIVQEKKSDYWGARGVKQPTEHGAELQGGSNWGHMG